MDDVCKRLPECPTHETIDEKDGGVCDVLQHQNDGGSRSDGGRQKVAVMLGKVLRKDNCIRNLYNPNHADNDKDHP